MSDMRNALATAATRLRTLFQEEILVLSVLAAIVGAGTGVVIILFRETIALVQLVFWGDSTERLTEYAAQLPWWQVVLPPVVGGLIVGVLVQKLMPGRRPLGVADAMEASTLKSGLMNLRTGIYAAMISALSIGCGASVGREGPAVHLGGTLGSWVARRLGQSTTAVRTLLGCGVAAAVATSFNAPIAGALFANEVVIGHYGLRVLAPVVIASVVSTAVSHAWFGQFAAFAVTEHPTVSIWELPAFAGLGVTSGLIAVGLTLGIGLVQRVAGGVPGPAWIRPAIGGLIVGLIAIPLPGVLGIGYGVTESALTGGLPLAMLVGLCLAKIVATAVSLGFGFGGGVFSPSLVIGATFGGAYGILATSIFPDVTTGHDAYTIIGMGAVAAGVLGAPISTTLIVFEMTGDYNLTMAVMLAAVIASVVANMLRVPSFFEWQLERRGLDLQGGFQTTLLRTIPLDRVVSRRCEIVHGSVVLRDLRPMLLYSRSGTLMVVDDDGVFVGTLSPADLAPHGPEARDAVTAAEVADREATILTLADDLEAALDTIASTRRFLVPVVNNAEQRRLVGCLHERDAIRAYNRALIRARQEEHT